MLTPAGVWMEKRKHKKQNTEVKRRKDNSGQQNVRVAWLAEA